MHNEKLPHQHGHENEADFYKSYLDNTENFETVADVFKLLGDTSRIRIFWLLCHFEECVINISAFVGMTSPAVSHHLKQLKSSGLIVSRREGKEVYYKAAETEQSRLLHMAIEKTMEISCPEKREMITTHYQAEQVDTIKKMHDYMAENLDKRITIEALSKQFLMNTTTLKELFKKVYGVSVATHMKQHRMERAAELLTATQCSVEEIARQVGYESQSKFTAAFKESCGLTPLEYRKNRSEKIINSVE